MKKDFFNKNGFRIIVVVVFLLSFIWLGTRTTIQSNSNSIEDWLPDQYQETRDYQWFLKHFPFESFVVASWEGCTLDNDRIELFAQKLVPDQTIDNFSLGSGQKQLLAEFDIHKIQDQIRQEAQTKQRTPQFSSEDSPDTGTPGNSNIAGNVNYFQSVLTGPRLVKLLEESYSRTPQLNLSKEELHQEICERLEGTLIGPDGKSTALIITLAKGPRDGKYLRRVLDRVREIAIECGLPNTVTVRSGNLAQKAVSMVADLADEMINGRPKRVDGLILGGPPVDNVALDMEGERTLFRLAGLCALIGGSLALLCLRSFRLTVFVFWVSMLAAGIALAMVSLTGGTCDSILLSMPALVYVLAMSGSIHIINYYHDAIRENGLQGAPERALEHAFTPCFFAQLTTAIGLGSLFMSQLVPITKFGFYSAIGVMTTLLLLFLYLPSLLYFYPSTRFAQLHGGKGLDSDHGFFARFWTSFGKFIVNNHNAVAIFFICLMAFFAWNLPKVKTSVKLMNFFSSDAEIINHYGWLEEKLGPLVPMEVVVSFDNSKLSKSLFSTINRLSLVNEISDALKDELHDDVGGTLSVGMFVPNVGAFWNLDSITGRMAGAVAGKMIDENREALRDYLAMEGDPSLVEVSEVLTAKIETLKGEVGNNEDAISALAELVAFFDACRPVLSKLKIDSLQAIIALPSDRSFDIFSLDEIVKLKQACDIWYQERGIELWRITIRVWALEKNIDYSRFIHDVRQVVEPILQSQSDEIMALKAKRGLEQDNSNGNLDKLKRDTAVASGMPVESLAPHEGGMRGYHEHDSVYPAGISAKYTGMVPLVYKTQHELLKGLVESLIMAFVLICIVLMIVLRSVPGGLVAMIPNMFPVICVFGFMSWRGILIDVGTMMTASVALGVAIDDTMHYLTWFSDGIHKGETPKEAAIGAYRRCAAAMTESTIICGFGLFAFAFSTFVPTQKFGMLMLAILSVALVGDLIFLPALLTGPLGRFFVMKKKN